MKIKCRNCNKHFDYEKNGGTCPKCGTVQPFSNTHMEANSSKHKIKTTHSLPPIRLFKRSKQYYFATMCILIAIIATAVIPILLSLKANQKGQQTGIMDPIPTPEIYSMGESITLKTTNGTTYLTITEITLDTDERFAIPEGYEILKVAYTIKPDSDNASVYSLYDVSFGIKPFLATKSGHYLSPISSHNLMDVKQLTYDERDANGLYDGFGTKNGYLYYMVKENDSLSLRLNCHHYNSVTHEDVEYLERVIEIQNLEVTR